MSVGWGQFDIDYYKRELINSSDNEIMIILNHEIDGNFYSDTTFTSISRLLPPCDEGYTEIDGECYYQSDLDVLQQFIDNSQEGTNPPPSDLSPIELGEQEWEDGRIISLCSSDWVYPYCPQDYRLSGPIPEDIGTLIDLEVLQLFSNKLSGEIPQGITNLTNLKYLWLGSNQLTGEIPSDIGNLTNLNWVLDLGHNQLSGEIPESIGNLMNITGLNLGDNELSGEIPENIYNLIYLVELGLYDNQLTGEISESIGDMTDLILIYISGNNFSDISSICENNYVSDVRIENLELIEIDDCFGNMSSLFGIFIGDNHLYCEDGEQNEDLIPDFLTDGSIPVVVGLNQQDCSEESECILGDLNNDSILNVQDIVLMITLILDGEYDECGDVNSDGTINVQDVVIFVNIILSIP